MSWISPFLEDLRTHGVVARACRSAGILSKTAYDLRKTDGDFAAAWDNALEDATDAFEVEARRRALDGINEPVVYQGQLTPIYEKDDEGRTVYDMIDSGDVHPASHPTLAGQPRMLPSPRQLVVDGKPQFLTINKKSDALLMFMLKGLRKKYGTETHEVTGKDGQPLATIDETKRSARLLALLELAKQRQGGSPDYA